MSARDPSGLNMSEVDLPRRLLRYGADVEIIRIAITQDDAANSGLPHFDADEKRRTPDIRGSSAVMGTDASNSMRLTPASSGPA
jgi:hypothetical protein